MSRRGQTPRELYVRLMIHKRSTNNHAAIEKPSTQPQITSPAPNYRHFMLRTTAINRMRRCSLVTFQPVAHPL